jgi:predicted DNA-binding transcriptional regulator AlpA
MNGLSTREAAKKLGISPIALSRYIAVGKVPAPAVIILGRSKVHVWTEAEIEQVRQLLPKIANGRKTRHKKKQSVAGTKQSRTRKKK